MRRFILLGVLAAAIASTAPREVSAQLGGAAGGGNDARIEGRYKVVPIPYINYNRSIGLTLGALPMVMFNPVMNDTLSPSSLGGLLGMYSTNDTWFLMGFTVMFFDEDNWRVALGGGRGSVNFQFYLDNPIDMWVPYNTRADFFFSQVQRRVYKRAYAGVGYIYMHFRTGTDLFPQGIANTLNGIMLNGSIDTRTNFYYPRAGFFTTARVISYPEWLDNVTTSNVIELDYNQYWAFRQNKDVLAARGFAGIGIGDLTFNQQFIVGQRDIRGYTQGEYRGDYKVALQGEYRYNFANRWGAVGFAGLATVFGSINEDQDGEILPGIGTGIRFTAFTDNNMNVGLDIAAGRNDWGIYFRIGEAF